MAARLHLNGPENVRVNCLCPGYIDTQQSRAQNEALMDGSIAHQQSDAAWAYGNSARMRFSNTVFRIERRDLLHWFDAGEMTAAARRTQVGEQRNRSTSECGENQLVIQFDFSGKRVLVTGSTMGIGRGAARGVSQFRSDRCDQWPIALPSRRPSPN